MDQSAVRHQGGSDRQARLERLIAPVVADTGFDVEEIVLRPAGRRTS